MKDIKENRIIDLFFEAGFRLVHGLAILCIAAMIIAGIVSYTLTGVSWLIEILNP